MKIDRPYILTGALNVSELIINSQFECSQDLNANLSITAKRIRVNSSGRFVCGTAESPFDGKLIISLGGNKSVTTFTGKEERAIEVLDGGVISLHGSNSVSWTELARSAWPGNTTIDLVHSPVGWKVLLDI